MRERSWRGLALASWLAVVGAWTPAAAQAPVRAGAEPLPAVVVDTLAVRPPDPFGLDSVPAPLEAGGESTRGVPLDLRVARRVRSGGVQESPWARGVAGALEFAAVPGSLLLAGALYGIGELDGREAMRDLGLHTGQAIVVAGAVSLAGKVAAGRARPYASPDDPYALGFGRGLSGDAYQSFPSAHTALAFASATVLALDLAERHPGTGVWLIPTAYGAASLSGLSRIFHDEHWATDVVAGALVGALSGWGVRAFTDTN